MIEFGRPIAFGLLLVVAAMVVAVVLFTRWRRRARERFGGPRAASAQGIGWHTTLLLLAAATLLVAAAAQPRWGSFQVSRERSGVDLVITLDVSQSMLAEDVPPSRLALAQDEVVRLVETQRGSRIGLVFFAGTAIVRSPLTTDTQALSQLIRRADREGQLTRAGSDIGAALDQAALILAAGEADGKAIVVVSDGEDHAGAFGARLSQLRDGGIAIYAAGVGSEAGSTINERDPRSGLPRIKLDGFGQPVVTRLNEATLQSLVAGGPGRYLRLDGLNSLVSLTDDLASLSQTPLGADLERVPVERFQWFAGAALALLALAWLLPERIAFSRPRIAARLRPSPGIALVLIALVVGGCGGGDSLRDDNASANRLFDDGDYEGALAAYQELLSQRPDLPELSYNVGNALHRLEEFERAVTETQRALPPLDPKLGALTFYALGNHLYALDELEQAYEAYRNALILDPNDLDSKHNLEITLLRLMQRPPPQQAAGPDGTEPTPGPQGQPGEPPQGTPTPSGQPAPAGTPQPTTEELQRSLQEALRGIDDELTFEEAVQILELLREQQERRLPPGPAGAPGGPDY